MATYFHLASVMLEPGSVIQPGNWGRMIQQTGPGHGRWLAEAAMEHVRATEFPDRPSRLRCAFFFDNLQTAMAYRDQHAQLLMMYEVEAVNESAAKFRANYEANMPDHMLTLDWCRRYWSGDIYPTPPDGIRRTEILSETSLRVCRVV